MNDVERLVGEEEAEAELGKWKGSGVRRGRWLTHLWGSEAFHKKDAQKQENILSCHENQ